MRNLSFTQILPFFSSFKIVFLNFFKLKEYGTVVSIIFRAVYCVLIEVRMQINYRMIHNSLALSISSGTGHH